MDKYMFTSKAGFRTAHVLNEFVEMYIPPAPSFYMLCFSEYASATLLHQLFKMCLEAGISRTN